MGTAFPAEGTANAKALTWEGLGVYEKGVEALWLGCREPGAEQKEVTQRAGRG